MNPIQYLINQGFRVTSDPTQYKSKIWGKRDYTVNGYNYDQFCGGYHRAYDLSKKDNAGVPAVCSGVVTSGTGSYGNFGGTVVIANKALGIQVIYGHLNRKLPVKIGRNVRQGDIIGHQSNTNFDNVPMASHLHIQFQKYGYIKGEKNFVCTGINPLKLNVEERRYRSAWLWRGEFISKHRINLRDFPGVKGLRKGVFNKGKKITFDKVYDNDGYWWARVIYSKETVFMVIGVKTTNNDLLKSELWGEIRNLNTTKGKE